MKIIQFNETGFNISFILEHNIIAGMQDDKVEISFNMKKYYDDNTYKKYEAGSCCQYPYSVPYLPIKGYKKNGVFYSYAFSNQRDKFYSNFKQEPFKEPFIIENCTNTRAFQIANNKIVWEYAKGTDFYTTNNREKIVNEDALSEFKKFMRDINVINKILNKDTASLRLYRKLYNQIFAN